MINLFIIILFFVILFITLYWYVYVFTKDTDEEIVDESTEDETSIIDDSPKEEVFNIYYNNHIL